MKTIKIKGLIKKFFDAKLKSKMVIIFLVLTVIPIITISGFTFKKSSDIIHSYITFSATQSFNQTFNFISYKFYKVVTAVDILALDDNLNDILMKDTEKYSYVEQVEDMTMLTNLLASFEDEEDIYRVKVYVPDGRLYSDENNNMLNIEKAKRTSWYIELFSNSNRIMTCACDDIEEDEPPILSFITKVKSRTDYSKSIGLLRIDVKKI